MYWLQLITATSLESRYGVHSILALHRRAQYFLNIVLALVELILLLWSLSNPHIIDNVPVVVLIYCGRVIGSWPH